MAERQVLDTNVLRQIFFILLILGLAILLYIELQFFVPAVLGAITFYVLFRQRMFYLTKHKNWKPWIAAVLLMLLSFLIILLPVGLIVNMLYNKVADTIQHSDQILDGIKKFIAGLEAKVGRNIVSTDTLNELRPFISSLIPKILGTTVDTLSTIAAMYFILYFMLINGEKMEDSLYEYIPLQDQNVDLIGHELHTMVMSNAIGIPLIAIIQGVVALVGYLILGVNEPWLWFAVTCVAAMLPVVGAALVYVPLSIMFFVNGEVWRGVVMAIWGFGLVGLVDNLFRFIINKRFGDIHPLITIFGVIIGIQLFGFIGLIFGPLLMSMFLVLLKVYSNEFLSKQRVRPRPPL